MSQTLQGFGTTPGAKAAPPAGDLVKDATIETFQADVLQASLEVPVIVDFWATWCGPCKTLGPILEREVKARGGAVRMVKVDVDKNQMLAQQLRIQSMPTVMVFVGGQPADGFVGAVPESEVKAFVDRSLQMAKQMGLGGGAAPQEGPGAADFVEAGREALSAGDLGQASQLFMQASQMAQEGTDEHAEALAGLALAYATAGQAEQAQAALQAVPAAKSEHPVVAQVRAQLALVGGGADAAEVQEAKAAFEANPDDQGAGYALAEAQTAAGDMEGAMATLLTLIEKDREWNEGAAKAKLLQVFDALGPTHPSVKTGRRRLSSILFS
jgi:putative thioredoxin